MQEHSFAPSGSVALPRIRVPCATSIVALIQAVAMCVYCYFSFVVSTLVVTVIGSVDAATSFVDVDFFPVPWSLHGLATSPHGFVACLPATQPPRDGESIRNSSGAAKE